ncbi:MAG: hypothetical protein GY822_23510 [Deltaproteobacteria bacterium]|nr:hypothetical protein [Deltaproteobacteria bacterium]
MTSSPSHLLHLSSFLFSFLLSFHSFPRSIGDMMSNSKASRPAATKAIFVLTVVKIALSFTFFTIITLKGTNPDIAQLILKTALAYVALGIPVVVFLHRHNVIGLRVCICLALLISLPARAYLGIVLDVIAFGLTFRNDVTSYFRETRSPSLARF